MDNRSSHSSQFERLAFAWHPVFSEHRVSHYRREDLVALEQGIGSTHRLTKDDLVKAFLQYKCGGDPDRYLYRNLKIARFLGNANIDYVRSNHPSASSSPHVLIDDRNRDTESTDNRGGACGLRKGPLNAHEFYLELCRKRYKSESGPANINIERRLIYITDADCNSILALIATASPLQIIFLRDFIFRNLDFRAFLGVKIPPTHVKTFALEFHLPYFAWRQIPEKSKRRPASLSSGPRLRTIEKVERLGGRDNNKGIENVLDYIFEAQISVMVTGIDHRFWTAYCFADVYFKDQDHNECVEYYHTEDRDPHSCGRFALDTPVWGPRLYFLRTMMCRMEQVKEEWNNVVFRLLQQIEPYTDKILVDDANTLRQNNQDLTQQASYKWTIKVLRKFTNLISKTIDIWEAFKEGEIWYFYQQDTRDLADLLFGPPLAAINKEVKELLDLRKSLEHQTAMFEDMTNSLATHAALAENRTLRRQSDFVQALTVITIFYLPAQLAASIYSMKDSMLPRDVKLQSYGYVMIGLTIATLVLVINLSRIIQLWENRGLWLQVILYYCKSIWFWFQFRVYKRRGKARPGHEEGVELEEQNATVADYDTTV